MAIDAEIGALDDLRTENMGKPRGERSVGRSGKGAVEVAPVGQIAAVADKAVDIDDGHADQRTRQRTRRDTLQKAAGDLDAGDFVAMDRGADEQHGAGLAAMDDADGQGDRLARR